MKKWRVLEVTNSCGGKYFHVEKREAWWLCFIWGFERCFNSEVEAIQYIDRCVSAEKFSKEKPKEVYSV